MRKLIQCNTCNGIRLNTGLKMSLILLYPYDIYTIDNNS